MSLFDIVNAMTVFEYFFLKNMERRNASLYAFQVFWS